MSTTGHESHGPPGELRIAVAGLGELGRLRLQHVLEEPSVTLVAVAGTYLRHAEDVLRKCGAGDRVRAMSYDDIFSADIDAVVVSGRTAAHAENAVRALRHGKHVLVEKPLGTRLSQASEVVEAANQSPCVVQVGYMRRFDQRFVALKELVDSGSLGTPLAVHMASLELFPPAGSAYDVEAGGLFVDIGVHDFDVAGWLLGSDPTRVTAKARKAVFGEASADNALVTIEYASGAMATTHLSRTVNAGCEIRCEVVGTEGVGRLLDDANEAGLMTTSATQRAEVPNYRVRFDAAFRAELRAFAASCRGADVRGATPKDDQEATAVAVAARYGASTGETVQVGPDWPWVPDPKAR